MVRLRIFSLKLVKSTRTLCIMIYKSLIVRFIKSYVFQANTSRERYLSMIKSEYKYSDEQLTNIDNVPFETIGSISMEEAEKKGFELLLTGEKIPINNWLWQKIYNGIVSSCPEYNLTKKDIYIGEVPYVDFTSSCKIYHSSQAVILLNLGLQLFLYRSAVLFIGNCSFRLDTYHPAIFKVDDSREYFRQNVRAMAKNEHLYPLRLGSNIHAKFAIILTHLMETFVLAHELGHLLINEAKYSSSVDIEYEADNKALEIYLKTIPNDPDIGHNFKHGDQNILMLCFSAPFFFFILTSAVELSRKSVASNSHPDPRCRLENLFKLLEKKHPDKILLVKSAVEAFLKVSAL